MPQKFLAYGEKGEPKALADLVRFGRPYVLVGDPGSGKSTVLHYLALMHAGELTLPDAPNQPLVPLYLELRDFSKGRAERPALVSALSHEAKKRGMEFPHPWFFEALLFMGDAVVLLDGLDEAGGQRTRAELADLIEAFQRDYPSCPVWVTSRVVGYTDTARLDDQVFTHYSVAEFGWAEQVQFVGKWYEVQIPNDAARRASKCRRFLAAVEKVPAVRRLAGNPLLLTLMALVHHYQNELPRNRGELYEQCVEMLLKHWQQTKLAAGDPDDVPEKLPLERLQPPISTDGAKALLALVALKVQERDENRQDEEGRGEIPGRVLRHLCVDKRARLLAGRGPTEEQWQEARSKASEDIAVFLDYVRERSGLLHWRGDDTFAFAHLSFLEFLAAYQLSRDPAFGVKDQAQIFLEKSDKPLWREALVQLLYLLAKNTGEGTFLDELLVPEIAGGAPPGFWLTLGIAVSDELVPAATQVREILGHLWEVWSSDPEFGGEAWSVLHQIAEFAETSRQEALLDLLAQRWAAAPASEALLALHLRIRLFGWPGKDAAEADKLAGELRGRLEEGRDAALVERAAALLADAGRKTVATRPAGQALVEFVQARLQALMWDEKRMVKERAASGSALGHLGDPRPGVGLDTSGPAAGLPALDFTTELLPAGEFKLAENGKKVRIAQPYRLARYPVTVAQFRAFATPENYANGDWWPAAIEAGYWKNGRLKVTDILGGNEEWVAGPANLEARFNVPNHPVVEVNWFEAAAFCRWLTRRLHDEKLLPEEKEIRLPHEAEWEQAARWNPGLKPPRADDRPYPWGGPKPGENEEEHLSRHCNWNGTGLGATSAAGLFPNGAAACGAFDMAGNVWEWCGNWYDEKARSRRVLRGGSWGFIVLDSLRCAYRNFDDPVARLVSFGFRCVVVVRAAAGG